MDKFLGVLLSIVASIGISLGITPEKITHDGSFTGPRVGYQSYCHPEQGFVIYEMKRCLLLQKVELFCGLKETLIAIKKNN